MSSDVDRNAIETNSFLSWPFPPARIQHAPFSAGKDIHSYNCIPDSSSEIGSLHDYEIDTINLFGMAETKSCNNLELVQFPPLYLVSEHDFHFRNCGGGNLLDSCSIHFTCKFVRGSCYFNIFILFSH